MLLFTTEGKGFAANSFLQYCSSILEMSFLHWKKLGEKTVRKIVAINQQSMFYCFSDKIDVTHTGFTSLILCKV